MTESSLLLPPDYCEYAAGSCDQNFDDAVILVGDFLLSKALSLAVTTDRLQILQVLANATTQMAEGEILQLIHAGNLKLTEAEYFEVITQGRR